MKYYRLKPASVPFFNDKYATKIQSFEYWEKMGIDDKALDVVEDAFISYGHQDKKSDRSSSLRGWDPENGQKFHFTIHFPSMKFEESDRFSNGKIVRELMESIQSNINHFMSDYYDGKNE